MTCCNFSAGPSHVPKDVLEKAQLEILDYNGTGSSFMELSHRVREGPVQNMLVSTQSCVRRLLNVPLNYHILFFQGGAHAQFSAVPLNLMGNVKDGTVAGYVDTGQWSQKAMTEAERSGIKTKVIAKSGLCFPPISEWDLSDDLAYVHVCANETMTGIEMFDDPDLSINEKAPVLVGDFTSTLMSRPIEISRYGVIYASSGKNLGPAGYTLVIVRTDLLDRFVPNTPPCLLWKEQAFSTPVQNVYNTPPTYIIHLSSMVLSNLEKSGGPESAFLRAKCRAKMVYDEIDLSGGFYANNIAPDDRSIMNIPFRIVANSEPSPELEKEFLQEAVDNNLYELAGHPQTGGLRATLYNSIPMEWTIALAEFMKRFKENHSGRRKP